MCTLISAGMYADLCRNIDVALLLTGPKRSGPSPAGRQFSLTLGMVATQRAEGMFDGVAKRSGIRKKLSLCGLWSGLQRLYRTMDLEYCLSLIHI